MSGPTQEKDVPDDGELTPNGGDYSIAYFSTATGVACTKAEAKKVEVVEYETIEGGDDVVVGRMYADVD